QAEDGIRDFHVTGVQTCALPIFTRRGGKHVIPQSDNAPCRDIELKVLHIAFGLHDQQFALPLCHKLDHLTRHVGRYIDHERLDRLALHAIDLLNDDLWLAYLELIPFAAHGFNQYGQVKDYPSINQKGVWRIDLDYL